MLYRERRTQERAAQKAAGVPDVQLHVIEDGVQKPLDLERLAGLLVDACAGLGDDVEAEPIMQTMLQTCTTACRWTKSTRRRCWPPAR